MENRGCANDVDDVDEDSSRDGIQVHDFAEEFLPSLPSLDMSSAPSGSSLYALLQLPSESKVYNRDVAHSGSVSAIKRLEHASPGDPTHLPTMLDSMEWPTSDLASNHDVAPGAFSVRAARNTARSQTFRSPTRTHDSPREITNEESKQEEGISNSAAAGSGLYTVEAERVPYGSEDGTMVVAEAQHLTLKWYQRPLYRWIFLWSIIFGCCLVGAVVVLVVLVVQQPAAATSSSSLTPLTPVPDTNAPSTRDPITTPPTVAPISGAPILQPTFSPISLASPSPKPIITAAPTRAPTTFLTPVAIACNFLSIPNVTKCRSTFVFDAFNNGDTANGDKTTGFTIPSEIGLLTQLTYLSFWEKMLTSTIPSEIGLLTQLVFLDFSGNSLTSTIPSEMGRLTKLMLINFYGNLLTSAIPSEIVRLTQLTALSFFDNNFNSSIPSEIGLLTQLEWLWLNSNSLTSRIPSEIGLLERLTYLFFSNNELTSTIPSEIGRLTQLKMLHFYDNALKGTIPSSLCSLAPLYGSISIDCGEITCAFGCCACFYF